MNNLTFNEIPSAIGLLFGKLEEIERLLQIKPSENNQQKEDPFLNVVDAAKLLNIAAPTLYNLVHTRKIPFYKRGKKLQFLKAELIEWITLGRNKTANEIEAEAEIFLNTRKELKNRG